MYIVEFKDNFSNTITNCIMQFYKVTFCCCLFFKLCLTERPLSFTKIKERKVFLEDLQISYCRSGQQLLASVASRGDIGSFQCSTQ